MLLSSAKPVPFKFGVWKASWMNIVSTRSRREDKDTIWSKYNKHRQSKFTIRMNFGERGLGDILSAKSKEKEYFYSERFSTNINLENRLYSQRSDGYYVIWLIPMIPFPHKGNLKKIHKILPSTGSATHLRVSCLKNSKLKEPAYLLSSCTL